MNPAPTSEEVLSRRIAAHQQECLKYSCWVVCPVFPNQTLEKTEKYRRKAQGHFEQWSRLLRKKKRLMDTQASRKKQTHVPALQSTPAARIRYDLQTAYENGVRAHPQVDVQSLGMNVLEFEAVEIAGCVEMLVENCPEVLPTHIVALHPTPAPCSPTAESSAH